MVIKDLVSPDKVPRTDCFVSDLTRTSMTTHTIKRDPSASARLDRMNDPYCLSNEIRRIRGSSQKIVGLSVVGLPEPRLQPAV